MLELFQVDAFTEQVFGGNPAAVVPLNQWPNDDLLQSIAAENNLAETAFIVPFEGDWEIRWFTPAAEVALCGHATLAAAHVVFEHLNYTHPDVAFITRESGTLLVKRLADARLSMSFPAIEVTKATVAGEITSAMISRPLSVWKGHYSEQQFDYLAVYATAAEVTDLAPDFSQFESLGSRGVIATAPGDNCDFVSRYFAPAFGIPEDPVTGSAHCLLAPYWAEQLGKNTLHARQVSKRGGTLECHVSPERVELIGHTVDYLRGELFLAL